MISVRVLARDNRPVDGLAVEIVPTYHHHHQDTATATTNQEGIAEFELHPNEYIFSLTESSLKRVIWAPLVIFYFMSRYCQ